MDQMDQLSNRKEVKWPINVKLIVRTESVWATGLCRVEGRIYYFNPTHVFIHVNLLDKIFLKIFESKHLL